VLAVAFTDPRSYFVSESTAYHLVTASDLLTSPAFTLMRQIQSS